MKPIITFIIITYVVWMFIPFLLLIIGSGLNAVLSQKKHIITNIMKVCFGFGNSSDASVVFQKSKLDCGEAALKNGLNLLDVSYDNFSISEPTTAEEIKKTGELYGVKIVGYEDVNLEFIESQIKSGNILLTLFKASYPFEGWWVRPTRWFFKYLVKDLQGYHWVTLEKIHKKKVYIIDPYFGRIKMRKSSFFDCSNGVLVIEKTGG